MPWSSAPVTSRRQGEPAQARGRRGSSSSANVAVPRSSLHWRLNRTTVCEVVALVAERRLPLIHLLDDAPALLRTRPALEDVTEVGSELEHELDATRLIGQVLDEQILVQPAETKRSRLTAIVGAPLPLSPAEPTTRAE
jgi:hypothetical protein